LLAEAAQIGQGLSERCLAAGRREKAWSHRQTVGGCRAQAGNFYQAIAWCDDLLAQTGLPDPFATALRSMSNNSALAGHAGMARPKSSATLPRPGNREKGWRSNSPLGCRTFATGHTPIWRRRPLAYKNDRSKKSSRKPAPSRMTNVPFFRPLFPATASCH